MNDQISLKDGLRFSSLNGGILGVLLNLQWWFSCCCDSSLGVSPAESIVSRWLTEAPTPTDCHNEGRWQVAP